MTVPWSHPLLLRGEAAVVDNATEADARPWIGPGVHLRVRCHPALGLPLCPFTVFDGGRAGPVGQPQPVDGVVPLPGASVVAAELAAPDKAIAALDAGRIASERRSPPFVVSTVGMSAVQAFSGPVRFYSWQPSPAGPASTAVLDAFGPPFPIGPWWSGPPAGHKDPPQRVQAGQLRVPPYDDTGINPVELASTQFSMVAGDVQAIWATPVGPGGAPVQQRVTKAMPSTTGAHDATADLDASSLIWASSLEAPASRWWGFATTLDPGVVNAPYGDGVQCVIVAALWAVPALPPPAPNQPDLGALVAAAARDPFASSIEAALAVQHAGLSTVIPPLRAAGLQVVPLWTVVATTPIPSSAPSTAPTSYTTTWAQD
ncbi:MAG: hypothetical protein JO086_06300, partial [Acidimicrobiia bacterium]|nr:hypothetical protein [Acidimicrobiia bacterium]